MLQCWYIRPGAVFCWDSVVSVLLKKASLYSADFLLHIHTATGSSWCVLLPSLFVSGIERVRVKERNIIAKHRMEVLWFSLNGPSLITCSLLNPWRDGSVLPCVESRNNQITIELEMGLVLPKSKRNGNSKKKSYSDRNKGVEYLVATNICLL